MPSPDLQQAIESLRAGGIIAYPTEAVYGLGCDPHNEAALQKLLSLKQRDDGKGVIIIAADYRQLAGFIAPHTGALQQRLSTPAATPTTWVVEAAATLSPRLTGGRTTIAVRITDHPVAAAICRLFAGPITSTSANLSGSPPAKSAQAVRQQFPQGIDTFIDAPVGTLSQPTQIIDAHIGARLR